MIQSLFNRSNTSRIVASDHILDFRWQFQFFFLNNLIILNDIDGDVVNITLDDVTKFDQKSYMDVTFARFRIAKDIWENMDFEKVNFVDSFEKKQEEDEEEAEE